ncbi:hypothetical protein GUITHDRAFT_154718 [Guillardia theta CCMP2712]|uniref:Uncharacterized protein n=1 Tax=Guillardia theta (strain CCMP2712) TaxID=905079 RepID=L1IQW2_GUITC|nr:hypothetical protein GUITHDRAFT_154718 [Guillardia theta CCMP2712]EKX38472.1 hypothetical protein GUITHDRAFT_154718 [Guillardia theta CCMP2712]|eukprot:XP_005825452.1 hypothetical protein GUITHDRAFT_154718 [Guillardia theta CCMP2712]
MAAGDKRVSLYQSTTGQQMTPSRWQNTATLKGRLEVSPLKSWTWENKGSDQRRQYYHDHLSGGHTRNARDHLQACSYGDTGPVKVKGAATSTSQRALDENRKPRHVKPMTLSQGTLKVRNQASDRSKNHIADKKRRVPVVVVPRTGQPLF